MASADVEEGFGARAGFSELTRDLLSPGARQDGVKSFSHQDRRTGIRLIFGGALVVKWVSCSAASIGQCWH